MFLCNLKKLIVENEFSYVMMEKFSLAKHPAKIS